jgi:hypothetical protein
MAAIAEEINAQQAKLDKATTDAAKAVHRRNIEDYWQVIETYACAISPN